LEDVQNLHREKWDWALPDGLLRKAYASHYLDLPEALEWTKTLCGSAAEET
jgi:ATP-dependent Lhr-like helicase